MSRVRPRGRGTAAERERKREREGEGERGRERVGKREAREWKGDGTVGAALPFCQPSGDHFREDASWRRRRGNVATTRLNRDSLRYTLRRRKMGSPLVEEGVRWIKDSQRKAYRLNSNSSIVLSCQRENVS